MDYKPVVANEDIDALFASILTLQTMEECYKFFEDICTVHEVAAMAQRLQVARLLRQGITYHEIVEKTGASTATISRVNRCLQYGAGGYNTALDRLEEQNTHDE